MNLTISSLITSKLIQRTPFLSLSNSYQSSQYQVHSSFLSKSFHTFLFSLDPQITINSSKFSYFLRTPIYVTAVSLDTVTYDGKIVVNSTDPINFINVNKHFSLIRCYFERNENTYIGGCVFLIGTNHELQVTTFATFFTNNTATLGGALYYNVKGTINITSSYFRFNEAKRASHIYLSGPNILLNITDLCTSVGKSSGVIQTIDPEQGSTLEKKIVMTETAFYKNEGQFLVRKGPLTMTSCSIFFVDDNSNLPFFKMEDFDPNGLTIKNTCLNLTFYQTIEDNPTPPLTQREDDGCLMYQIIPTPSITLNPKISDINTIISIMTPIFCFILSIFGIIFVGCHCLKPIPQSDEEEADLISEQSQGIQ